MNHALVTDAGDGAFPTALESSGMRSHYTVFTAYAHSFYTGDAAHDRLLELKAGHTRNVFTLAHALAGAEPDFAAGDARPRALLLAALFHDFGRFPQYDRYGTFSDARSVNHAHLAVRELRRLAVFDEEKPTVTRLALSAVLLHNRISIPGGMPDDFLAVTRAVRDADKLDILRIMAEDMLGPDSPDPVVLLEMEDSPEVSPAIMDAVLAKRLGSYADMRTTADFKLLLCGWFYALEYDWSRKTAVARGHLRSLADSLPRGPAVRDFVARYREDLAAHGA